MYIILFPFTLYFVSFFTLFCFLFLFHYFVYIYRCLILCNSLTNSIKKNIIFFSHFIDNKSTNKIAYNLVQHDCTKHMERDKYFTKEKLDNGLIYMPYTLTRNQLALVLTKGLNNMSFQKSLTTWK